MRKKKEKKILWDKEKEEKERNSIREENERGNVYLCNRRWGKLNMSRKASQRFVAILGTSKGHEGCYV